MRWAPAARAASRAAWLAVTAPSPRIEAETTSTCSAPSKACARVPGIGEVARAHAHAPRGQRRGGVDVADADPDRLGRDPLEQAVDDLRAEAAGGAGDDEHGRSSVSNDTPMTLPLIRATLLSSETWSPRYSDHRRRGARLLREQGAAALTTRGRGRGGRGPAAHALPPVRGQGRADRRRRRARDGDLRRRQVRAASTRTRWPTCGPAGGCTTTSAWRTPSSTRCSTGAGRNSPATVAGIEVLRARVRRLATAGVLGVSEERALELIHAAGSGTVLALLVHAARAARPRPGRRDARSRAGRDPHRRSQPRHPPARPRSRSSSPRSSTSCPRSATPNGCCSANGWPARSRR